METTRERTDQLARSPRNVVDTNIDRLERPSREEFFENYVKRNRPVILRDVASRWPAMEKWTPDYLDRVAGDSKITVHYHEAGDFQQWYLNPGGRQDLEMPFGQFLDQVRRPEEGRQYYMTEHELRLVSPELLRDVDVSRYIDETDPLLFVGHDTFMPLHYHGTTEALLSQITGTKTIWLFSPDQFKRLYAGPWYSYSPLFSRVDPRRPDFDRFPGFRDAVPLEFTLHPGEILFIPVHWWHVTSVTGYQVSMTCFWKAGLRQYTYPSPAFQVFAREVVWQTKNRLEKARAKLRASRSAAG